MQLQRPGHSQQTGNRTNPGRPILGFVAAADVVAVGVVAAVAGQRGLAITGHALAVNPSEVARGRGTRISVGAMLERARSALELGFPGEWKDPHGAEYDGDGSDCRQY